MKKKILVFINSLSKGGAETALANSLNQVNFQRYKIDLIYYEHYPNIPQVKEELPPQVRQIFFPHTRHGAKEFCLRQLMKLIANKDQQTLLKKYNYAGYHLWWWSLGHKYDWAINYGEWFSNFFVAKVVSARRKVLWIQNDLSKLDKLGDWQDFLSAFDKIVFLVPTMQARFLKLKPNYKKKTLLIPNIHYRQKILAGASQKNILSEPDLAPYILKGMAGDEKFGCSDSQRPFLIVTVAHYRRQKNYGRHLQVAARLKKLGLKFQWLAIGAIMDQTYYQELTKQQKQLGLENDFIFLGAKTNPYPYIKTADLFVILSDYEGQCNVLGEAMILGTGVLATKTAGAIATIKQGQTGWKVGFEVDEIASKIMTLASDEKARARVKENLIQAEKKLAKKKTKNWLAVLEQELTE